MLGMTMVSSAVVLPFFQVDPTQQNRKTANAAKPPSQPILENGDETPDSLINPRWKIQRTTPITYDDLEQNAMDLKRPEGLMYEVVYNDTIDRYIIGTKIGSTYLAAPIMMTPEEYMKWSEKHGRDAYYRSKNLSLIHI